MRRLHYIAFLFMVAVPLFGDQGGRDALVIGTVTSATAAASVPLYVRDAVDTPLGDGSDERIGLIELRVVFSEPAIIEGCSNLNISECNVTFVPGGILAGKTPQSLIQIREPDAFTLRAHYPETESPEFTTGVDAPGDLIGRLDFVLIPSEKPVSEIRITADRLKTQLWNSERSVVENDGNQFLRLIDGSIGIGSSCEGAPSPATIAWRGASSGCTEAVSNCQVRETVSFTAVPGPAQRCERAYWTFDDHTVVAGTTVDHAFATPGAHRVAVTVMNEHGTGTTVGQVAVPIVCAPPPMDALSISWTGTQGCTQEIPCATGELITFQPVVAGDGLSGCEHFLWDLGDDTSSIQRHPRKAYAISGEYTVRLTIVTPLGQRDASANVTIVSNQPGRRRSVRR